MTTVQFLDDPNGEWVTVKFPYDPELVAMVKTLSSSVRKYDPKSKSWSVFDEHAPRLADEMARAGHQVLVNEEPPAPPSDAEIHSFFGLDATTDGYDPTQAAADIIAAIPGQHVGKVFRAMAKKLYPDLYEGKP